MAGEERFCCVVNDNEQPEHANLCQAPPPLVDGQAGQEALLVAAAAGNLEELQGLLRGRSRLQQASMCKHALWHAAKHGQMGVLQGLANQRPDLLSGEPGADAFQAAAAYGQLLVVKWLVGRHPPVLQGCSCKSAVWHAAKHGQLGVLQWLVEKREDLLTGEPGADAFQAAAAYGQLSATQWIASRRPEVLQGWLGSDTFRVAAQNGQLSVVQWLAERQPRLLAGVSGANALQAATQSGSCSLVAWMQPHCDAAQRSIPTPKHLAGEWFKAARYANVETAKRLAAACPASFIELQDNKDEAKTALHHAAGCSNNKAPAMLTWLLQQPDIDVNSRDCSGWTPLHRAVYDCRARNAEVLLADLRVQADATCMEGNTPLRFVLERYGNKNDVGEWDNDEKAVLSALLHRLLHLDDIYGTVDIFEVRSRAADDPVRVTFANLLQEHAWLGHANLVEALCLIVNVCDINKVYAPPNDMTALHFAARNGQPATLRVLLNVAGIQLTHQGTNTTALHQAAISGSRECVRLLYNRGSNMYEREGRSQKTAEQLLVKGALEWWAEECKFRAGAAISAANAFLVAAVLIATLTFSGFLTPPNGWYPDPTVGNYLEVHVHHTLLYFCVFTSLSYFFSLATLVVAASVALPVWRRGIAENFEIMENILRIAAWLLILAVLCVLAAFALALKTGVDEGDTQAWHAILSTIFIGGMFCVVALYIFIDRMFGFESFRYIFGLLRRGAKLARSATR